MKNTLTLTITSVISILLMTFHFTSDTLRARVGSGEAGGLTLIAVPILVVWLYGALMLAERRSGHVIMLIGSLLAILMPAMHADAAAGFFHGQWARGNGDFVFVWTLHALGVTGVFGLILAIRGLWQMRRDPATMKRH